MGYFTSEAELAREWNAVVALTYASFGVLCYDWLMSLRRFDLPVLTGKVKWRMPQFLYFANRACGMIFIVLSMVANAAANDQTSAMPHLACESLVKAILVFAVMQTTLSSFVLAFRCMALYKLNLIVVGLLSLMMALQLAFAIPVITEVPWSKGNPKGAKTCLNALTISDDSHLWCAINYTWTSIVDFTVLLLSIHRLTSTGGVNVMQSESRWNRGLQYWSNVSSTRSRLGSGRKSMAHFLIDQGVGAVLLTFLINCPVLILEYIHLNGMAVFTIYNSGVVLNGIISCHVIMGLHDHAQRQQIPSGSGSAPSKYLFSDDKNMVHSIQRTDEIETTSSQIELTDRYDSSEAERHV